MNQVVALDLETTGFGKNDRVIEIGLVVFDLDSNRRVGQMETLLNPGRNIPQASSEVHGIRAEHLSLAPTFSDVSDFLLSILEGRTLVAHNAAFDIRFLNQEFSRLGVDFSFEDVECTYDLTGQSLAVACRAISFDFEHHSAVEDARASLAIWLSSKERDTKDLRNEEETQESQMFRTLRRSQVGLAPNSRGDSPLAGLRVNLKQTGVEQTYMGLLDSTLRDFSISKVESLGLAEFAASSGISELRVGELHDEYLQEIDAAAMRDGIVTELEAEYFNKIAEALGSKRTLSPNDLPRDLPPIGSLICATGTLTYKGVYFGKAEISSFLLEKGYLFTDVLSKKAGVSLLLQESAGSQSSKVAKAQAWGIPRMVTSDFLSLF
jgi:DNA polymerase-3 subunit epsilon